MPQTTLSDLMTLRDELAALEQRAADAVTVSRAVRTLLDEHRVPTMMSLPRAARDAAIRLPVGLRRDLGVRS